jgi:hypothetical protein
MASGDAFVGYGATLSMPPRGSATGSLTVNIKSIEGPSWSRDFIDATPQDTQHKRKLPGRIDPGQLTLELFCNSEDHRAKIIQRLDNTIQGAVPDPAFNFVVSYPDGTSYTCSGFVASATPKNDGGDAHLLSVTFEITGPVITG